MTPFLAPRIAAAPVPIPRSTFLYQTLEKAIRFLMTEGPKDRISKFIGAMLEGTALNDAILSTYSIAAAPVPIPRSAFRVPRF